MNAEYADYDGKPHVDESNHWHFYSDAYRTAANIGLDAAWNGPQEVLCDRVAALQRFFLTHDRTSVYAIDGTAVSSMDDLNAIKNQHTAGDTVQLTVYRAGQTYEVSVTLMDRNEAD